MSRTDPKALLEQADDLDRDGAEARHGEALREYAELVAAISYCAWDANACARWDGCDTAEDIVRVAKDCGWPGLGRK